MRLIIFLFVLPWWLYLPLAVGVGYLGQKAYEQQLGIEAVRSQALSLAAPMPVDLSLFSEDRDVQAADEVNVTGWINPAYNYTLIERTNFIKTSERYMFVLFGAEDDTFAREVKAVMVFSASERDQFLNNIEDYIVGFTDAGEPLFEINGFNRAYDSKSSMVSEALSDEGLTKAPDFFYLEPFLNGREAALAPHGGPQKTRGIFFVIAVAVALYGLVKRKGGSIGSAPPPKDETAVAAVANVQPKTPGGANKAMNYDYVHKAKERPVGMSSNIDPDSPLGRIAMREMQPQVAPVEAHVAPLAHSSRPEPASFDLVAAMKQEQRKLIGKLTFRFFSLLGAGIVVFIAAAMSGNITTMGLSFVATAIILMIFSLNAMVQMFRMSSALSRAKKEARSAAGPRADRPAGDLGPVKSRKRRGRDPYQNLTDSYGVQK